MGNWGTGPEHWLSDEERERFADEAFGELERLIKEQFPRTTNLEYAVLKAHLIVEYAITEHIRGHSAVFVEHGNLKRFTFSQKLEIAYLQGFGANDPVIFPTVERLNKIRNQVAHSFVLDRTLVDEMLRVNSEGYDDFVIENDRQRIKQLRWLCAYICGRMAGELQSHIIMERKLRDAYIKELDDAAS
ncbi:hypothetical protein [Tsuneonella suprasediminis]|uniref:hypothetical protein n=1 Tax=Tsuneonella suprasediminis TaxID=2306996 RepID=UPI002F92FC2E